MVSAVYRPETRSIVITCTGEGLPELIEGDQVPECMLAVESFTSFVDCTNGKRFYRAEIEAINPTGNQTLEEVVARVNAALRVQNA